VYGCILRVFCIQYIVQEWKRKLFLQKKLSQTKKSLDPFDQFMSMAEGEIDII